MKKSVKQLFMVIGIFIFTAIIILTTQIYFTGNSVNEESISQSRELTAGEQCSDGIDNDDDGLIDMIDLNCGYKEDNTESGTVYYISDCQSGADPNCIPGNDSNPGTNINAPRLTLPNLDQLQAGTTVALAKGSSFIRTSQFQIENQNCQGTNRCMVRSYSPSWASGNEERPILTFTAGTHAFNFENGGDPVQEEGFVIRDIELRGTILIGEGIRIYNEMDHVLVDNVIIDGFSIGIHPGGTNPGSSLGGDGENTDFVVRNSVIKNAGTQGWLGGADGLVIENNTFTNNGFDIEIAQGYRNHNIYLAGNFTNALVKDNVLYKSAVIEGACRGASFTAHGIITNLTIEGNYIYEDLGGVVGGCWGLSIDGGYVSFEQYDRLIIRGNTVKNVGNMALGCQGCTNTLIENNIIIQETASMIKVPSKSDATGDAQMYNITLRNNNVYFGSSIGSSTGISLGDTSTTAQGNGFSAIGNIVYYAGTNNGINCFSYARQESDYDVLDYNLCYTPNAPTADWEDGSGNITNWQSNTQFDDHSITSNPLFINAPDNFSLAQSSPAINTGHPTLSASKDFYNNDRDSQPDIGSIEFNQQSANQCSDGIDNDDDGLIDFGLDLCCVDASDDNESCPTGMSMKDGWHVFEKSADTRVIYVSNSTGNDSWDGISSEWNGTSGPKKTISAGITPLRSGYPDWLLLKRGDSWEGGLNGWDLQGSNTSHPTLIGSYGNSTIRPILRINGQNVGISLAGNEVHNFISIVGINFYAHQRDPNSTDYLYEPEQQYPPIGIYTYSGGTDLLIEDSKFSFFLTNIILQGIAHPFYNVTLRRSIIVDSYSNNGSVSHSQGIYMANVNDFLIEENLFDHNGWNENVLGAEANMFNHNLYIDFNNSGGVVRKNIATNTPSSSIMLRSGGNVTENFLDQNPISIIVGNGYNNLSDPSYVIDNVILGGSDMPIGPGQATGWGIEVNPSNPLALIQGNLIAKALSLTALRAINFEASLPNNIVPTLINNATGNVIYDWGNNLISDYNFGTSNAASIALNQSYNTSELIATLPDPNRSASSYNAYYGGEETLEAFIENAINNSRFNWDERYTAAAVNDYIRAGFNMSSTVYDDPVVANCTDGIQNQDETGIDCGGSCSACPIIQVENNPSSGGGGGGGGTTIIKNGANSTTGNTNTTSTNTNLENQENNSIEINVTVKNEENQNVMNKIANSTIKLISIIAGVAIIIGIIWFGFYKILFRKR